MEVSSLLIEANNLLLLLLFDKYSIFSAICSISDVSVMISISVMPWIMSFAPTLSEIRRLQPQTSASITPRLKG